MNCVTAIFKTVGFAEEELNVMEVQEKGSEIYGTSMGNGTIKAKSDHQ